jgi:phosphatidylglycerol:prolipoprotein diacylglycerol transferase
MRQVLFWIPIHWLPFVPDDWMPQGIPVYGFGLMLFLTFVTCVWLASRRARKEGIDPKYIQDLAIWIFVGGIIGARLVYMRWGGKEPVPIEQFFRIWEGGLVFYGSAVGGVVGSIAYLFVIRKHHLNTRQLADIVAPTVAWGLMLGRVGCLLNGCCFGGVTCPKENCSIVHFPPSLSFPVHSPPWHTLVDQGYQTAAGFTMSIQSADARTVGTVDPDSPAADAGLQPGDVIVQVNGKEVHKYDDLVRSFGGDWPRGQSELDMTVKRGQQEVALAFTPRTFGLHPTQIYESVSMLLLFLLLNAYYPLRRHYGEVFVLLILCYCVHRFINEMLRNDTQAMFGTGMTLSMNGSLLFLVVAAVLFIWLRRQPIDPALAPKSPEPQPVAG